MTQPSARVLADSVAPTGHRVTTLEVTMHRFVLAEFNTHCVLSRNSASSRAIPLTKQLERVREDPAIPISWPHEQRGMQGGEEITEDRWQLREQWREARNRAYSVASDLRERGVHKSVANRLLEPFMWHRVIATAACWENFFDLRCSPLAQPELRAAAEAMREVYRASTPTELTDGEWHLPLVHREDRMPDILGQLPSVDYLRRLSVARCARVSYLTHDGRRDPQADLSLHDRLLEDGHLSPFEHVCTPASWNLDCVSFPDPDGARRPLNGPTVPHIGKFPGWLQYRHLLEARQGRTTYR